MAELDDIKKINGLIFYSQDIDALEMAEQDQSNKKDIANIRAAMIKFIEELIVTFHQTYHKYPTRDIDEKSIDLKPGTIKDFKWKSEKEKPKRIAELCINNKSPIVVAKELLNSFNQATGKEIEIIDIPVNKTTTSVELNLNLPTTPKSKDKILEGFSLISSGSIKAYQIILDRCDPIDIASTKLSTEIPTPNDKSELSDNAKRSLNTLADALIIAVNTFINEREDLSDSQQKALRSVSIKAGNQTTINYLSQKYICAGFTIGKVEILNLTPPPPTSAINIHGHSNTK